MQAVVFFNLYVLFLTRTRKTVESGCINCDPNPGSQVTTLIDLERNLDLDTGINFTGRLPRSERNVGNTADAPIAPRCMLTILHDYCLLFHIEFGCWCCCVVFNCGFPPV